MASDFCKPAVVGFGGQPEQRLILFRGFVEELSSELESGQFDATVRCVVSEGCRLIGIPGGDHQARFFQLPGTIQKCGGRIIG